MYSPKLSEELIQRLYKYRQSLNKKVPMTKIVSEAIQSYLDEKEKTINQTSTKG